MKFSGARIAPKLVLVVALAFVNYVNGQGYIPVPDRNPEQLDAAAPKPKLVSVSSGLITKSIKSLNQEGLSIGTAVVAEIDNTSANLSPSSFPICNPIPTRDQVAAGVRFNHGSMSLESAIKANLPILQITGGINQRVFVRDITRTATCIATDGVSEVIYGQAVRMLITVTNSEASVDLSLPVIAANATIKNQSNRVNIELVGFSNPESTVLLSSLVNTELNVESYSKFLDAAGKIMALLDAPMGTTTTIARIGIVPKVKPSALKDGVVAGYALTQISSGKTCIESKSLFKSTDPSLLAVIDSTYTAIMGSCSLTKPDARNKLDADDQLNQLKVKY